MSKYRYFLIGVDVLACSLADLYGQSMQDSRQLLKRLYAHLLQDLSLLFSLLLILLQFFSKDILRRHMLKKVLVEHWCLLGSCLLYLCLTITWQILFGRYRQESTLESIPFLHLLALRLASVFYYFALAKPISLSHGEHSNPQTQGGDLSY